jgi:hypothetical protein
MNTTPLQRVEQWLDENNKKWADLARMMGYTEQRTTNWKTRGIPQGQYSKIKEATGMSLDYIAYGTKTTNKCAEPENVSYFKATPDPLIDELVSFAKRMNRDGLLRLVERAKSLTEEYPSAKAKKAR